MIRFIPCGLSILLALIFAISTEGQNAQVAFKKGDHVCCIGNTMADRMQHHGWLETYIHKLFPEHDLVFRNLAFSGDELKKRPRSENFGSADQWLEKCKADVIFCFFGYNEALNGAAGWAGFKNDLAELIDQMQSQKYNGKSAPRLVFFTPIAHENLNSPHLPDGSANNANLKIYAKAMQDVCKSKNVACVDLFSLSSKLYENTAQPLTMNGIHLLDSGNQILAREIIPQLFPGKAAVNDNEVAELRTAVLEKNYYWFSRYRVVDGYNVYGGRSKLAWFDQSNADVMLREMEIFDVMTANRDKKVWATAQGKEYKVVDNNIPEELVVKRNKEGPLEGGAFPYLDGEEAIKKMTIHDGMKINLFASEKEFPRLINPVQMAVDTDSRLWASVWESYPHWNPTLPRKDALVILPDEDGDGRADECKIFADELNSITGFEFWGGGVLVAAPPEIWFLKDTDGDDKADFKLRVLQGVSSADTHHSANAVLIGPDGWLYFSRGVFNVANFETPTKTYRSGETGVHRFNPRTFEVEFHFPIGPNPHGDVFDRWGYQFANDGTGGTGSYVNIGKGVPNKKWFKKRVRPVPSNGILSSSHFPEEIDGNFLISNAIGFLGVLQLKQSYNGADITGTEIDPIMFSDDPNFRPSDMEVGGDGALYIADWHNALIGHMQHNMRDPNRDHTHGRVYRVTYEGRDLLKPAKMKGKPAAEVLENLFAWENGTRYRVRLEMSGRPTKDVIAAVKTFTDTLDPKNASKARDEAQALLECLWIHEEHRVPNLALVKRVYQAQEPRVRAAAIRTLGHWATKLDGGWQELLMSASQDESALVRAEAVKSAVDFVDVDGRTAAETIFEANTRPLDPEMETVLAFAKENINVDRMVSDSLANGQSLSAAARAYVLAVGSASVLEKLGDEEDVLRAILTRKDATAMQLKRAISSLSAKTNKKPVDLLFTAIADEQAKDDGNVVNLGLTLASQPAADLRSVKKQIKRLATEGQTAEVKSAGYAAWVTAVGPGDAFLEASKSADQLRDFLNAIPIVDERNQSRLFEKIEPLIFELPAGIKTKASLPASPGLEVSYYKRPAKKATNEVFDKMKPDATSVVSHFKLTAPEGQPKNTFANSFKGYINIPKAGVYRFYTASDDGSRLYLDGKMLVDNDGFHGAEEQSGKIRLAAGNHSIRVNYFDGGGASSLVVYWKGPEIPKQEIPAERLMLRGEKSLSEIAIDALAAIPGNDSAKFNSLAKLIGLGKHRAAAIAAFQSVPTSAYNKMEAKPLVDNLIGYLTELPVKYRTNQTATDAMKLARNLGQMLSPEEMKSIEQRLQNLDVRVIAIGTVTHRMIYDKEQIVVQAGTPVEFRFSNTDSMPHNFAIAVPGALAEVGELAEETGRDADAMARGYIPKSKKVLAGSKLLQPGESQAISFEVPKEPGVYPYVCTYPGHWRRMFGALYVVPDFSKYSADPDGYLASLELPIKDELLKNNTRGREWKFEEFVADIKMMKARSHEVGKASFVAANCIGCHKFDGQGREFGPDLATMSDEKRTAEHIIRSMLEPSKDIDKKYSSTKFELDTGDLITGMIMEENDDVVKVIIDPLAKDQVTVIEKEFIEGRKESDVSPMPAGMVDKLSKEEILDLVAYVISGGDKKHKLFEGHEHGHGGKMPMKKMPMKK